MNDNIYNKNRRYSLPEKLSEGPTRVIVSLKDRSLVAILLIVIDVRFKNRYKMY